MGEDNPLTRAARSALLAVGLSAPFAFALGMPWNDLGLWSQVETVTVGLHVASAFAALCLAALLACGDPAAGRALRSPAVLVPAAMGILTLALAPLAEDPWRSVHGTLKHGVGGLWHLEVAVLAATYAVLLAGRARVPVLVAAVASVAAVCGLYAAPGAAGLPLAFPEWVGLLGAAVAGAVALSLPGPAWARLSLAAATLLWSLAVSGNRGVALAVAASLCVVALSRLPAVSGLLSRRAARAALAPAAALACLAAVALVGPLVQSSVIRSGPADGSASVASAIPVDRVRVELSPLGTLWGRSNLVVTAMESWASDPLAIVAGRGWGSFASAMHEGARDVPGRVFPVENGTASLTYWDGHEQSNFHSHNVLAETLLSVGLLGGLLWLAWLAALGASSPAAAAAAVGLAVASSLWFPLGHFTAAIALLAASASMPSRPSAPALGARGATLAAAALAVLAAALLVFSSALVALARAEHAERYFQGVAAQDDSSCFMVSAALVPDRDANVDLYGMLVKRILRAEDPAASVVEHTTQVAAYSCVMRRYWREEGDLRALVASLENRASLVRLGKPAEFVLVKDVLAWGADVDAALAALPGRTEFAVPYVLNLAKRDPAQAVPEALRLAGKAPEGDPVRSWLLSVAARLQGSSETSDRLLAEALEQGFANLVPIDAAEIESLNARISGAKP